MSNPVSLFERLNKEKPKPVEVEKPRLELVEDTQPTQDTQPIEPNQSKLTNPTKLTKPVSPKNDFTKVANSIARQAIPERLFKGMSKNTYDALYLKTRGAINPVRRIRATKSDLIRWTGVSDVTLDKHIKHLKSVGLVKVDFIIGSHEGNWYEIFIPEEIDLTNILNQPNQPNQDNIPKKVGGEIPNLVGGDWVGKTPENIGENASPKTSLKTDTNDDEAFAGFIEKIQNASKKLTGKKLSKYEKDNLARLADLLILELEIAARRTDHISSVPAFLTEVLRRQFFSSRQQQSSLKVSKVKIDNVGKSDSDPYEIKPLDQKGREEALEQLREFAGDDFLQDFKKWYMSEDWMWLEKKLKSDVEKK